jgi:hypothetical protein
MLTRTGGCRIGSLKRVSEPNKLCRIHRYGEATRSLGWPATFVSPVGIYTTILGHLKYNLKLADLLSADVRQNQRSKLRFGYDGALNVLSEAPGYSRD